MELVTSLGADAVIDYTKEDVAKSGTLYDVIFDAVPAAMIDRKSLKLKCQKSLAHDGRYIAIDDGRPEFSTQGLQLLKELQEAGKFKPVIDRCYPLEQIAEAHRYVEKGHKKGNVIITIS